MSARFPFAMARREARTAWRRFVLYGACMAIGIAAVVGLQALRSTVRHAIDAESRALLGSDLRLEGRAPVEASAGPVLAGLVPLASAPPAHVVRFASMALAPRSERTRLVDVQAVDAGFPLHGEVRTAPPGLWQQIDAGEPIALVDPSLLVQLDARVGDALTLGRAQLRIAGTVARAPGSFGMATRIAPRVFIGRGQLAATGLVTRGSLVEHQLHWKLRGPHAADGWLERNRAALEAAGVRVQTLASYQQGLSRSFASLTRYLGLVGVAALALGTIGVAAGVRVFLREKRDTVGLLRALGARPREVVTTYALLALSLGGAAGAAGIALCFGLQRVFPAITRALLPFEVGLRLEASALLTGLGLGLLATLLCAAAPLLELSRVPPLRVLRRDAGSEVTAAWPARVGFGALAAAAALGASVSQAPSWRVGVAFALGMGAALGVLAATAAAAAARLRRHPPRRAPFWMRQGIANLFRPRNHTLSTVVAIGFALFLVTTLHVTGRNVLSQIAADDGPDRPNLVLFDVQPDQREPLDAFLAARGVAVIERAPLVSARLAGVRGSSARQWLARGDLDREARWALQREYQLTWADALRRTERVVDGRWWHAGDTAPADAPSPVSIERTLAERLGLGIGDAMTWNVQGVLLESRVASIREVDWGALATNFFVVLPPAALAGAPHRLAVLGRLDGAPERAALLRDLVVRFPNVSALDATAILQALGVLLDQVGRAIRLLGAFTLATGLAIALAAAGSSRDERRREALLLRTLGASRATVRRIAAAEAVALGALAAGAGALLALAASFAVVTALFELPFDPPWLDVAGLALAALAVTALAGSTGGGALRDTSPFAALREARRSGAGAS